MINSVKNQTLKTIAFFLALVMLIGFIPARRVYAAPPPPATRVPVNDLRALSTDVPATAASNEYNIRFTWTQPRAGAPDNRWSTGPGAPTATSDPRVAPFHGAEPPLTLTGNADGWTRYASRYLFTVNNRTLGGPAQMQMIPRTALMPTPPTGEIAPNTALTLDTTLTFQPSSLYLIDLEPQHFTPVWTLWQAQPDPLEDIWRMEYPLANWETPGPLTPVNQQVVFMSDIEIVSAVGSGTEIVVEWLNPLWDGRELFSAWEISWFDSVTGSRINPLGVRQVPDGEDFIERLDGGRRLRYTIVDPRLEIGGSYHVSVEPMHDLGRRVRPANPDAPGAHDIFIDGVHHFLAYRSWALFGYQTEVPVLMIPELNLIVEGANLVRLVWERMAAGAIGRIEIEQWHDPRQPDPPQGPNYGRDILVTIPHPQSTTITEWPIGVIDPPMPRAWSIAVFEREDLGGAFLARSNLVYWTPEDAHFTPYAPELEPIEAEVIGGIGNMALTWRAFTRPPYNEVEEALLEQPPHNWFDRLVAGEGDERHFIDFGIWFHIFVADSWENLQLMPWDDPTIGEVVPHAGMIVPPAAAEELGLEEGVPYYRRVSVNMFSRPDGAGGFTHNNAVMPNANYFVRIIALREHPSGHPLISQPSYGIVVIPPDGDLIGRPEMIAAPPLRGRPNAADQPPSITLEWDLRYIEMYSGEGAHLGREWHSSAGVLNGALAFGKHASLNPEVENWNDFNSMLASSNLGILRDRESHPLRTPAAANHFLYGSETAGPNTIPPGGALANIFDHLEVIPPVSSTPTALRIQDMYYRSYQIHVVTYEHLMGFAPADNPTIEGAFEAYRDQLPETAWGSVFRPEPENGVSRFGFTTAPGVGAIQANTTYVVLMRPVETRDNRLVAFFPAYVVVTTPDDSDPAVPTPTTPVLFPHVPVEMDRITVRWRRQEGIRYELRWSEDLQDYPEGGQVIPWEEMEAPYLFTALINELEYYAFTITGLFVDTRHYVWARAVNEEDVSSGWSNPVDMRTLNISPPAPPVTLGPAGQNILNRYNTANNTDYRAIEPEAIIVAWSRIIADMRNDGEKATGGAAAGGAAVDLDIPGLDNIFAVRFSGLVGNRDYYIRARTVLTVTRGSPGETVFTYGYEVQLADNLDFLDAITFSIPPITDIDPLNARRAYSTWVLIELRTGATDDEFDGVHRPDQFPLPERDWDITYDPSTQTLNWRFRTNRVGSDGRPDQNVDQRFISRLISERQFVYGIDVSRHQNLPISNRVIEVPLSIMRAFQERGITFEVHTGDLIYSFPPGAFNTAEVRSLQQGMDGFFQIILNTNPAGMPALQPNTGFATAPQRLSVTAATPQRRLTLDTFALPVGIILPMANHIGPVGINTGVFQSGAGIAGWSDMLGQFAFAGNTLRAETRRPGTFAGITRNPPPTIGPTPPGGQVTPADAAMQRVTSRINITDLIAFDPNQAVSATAFNNLVHAVTTGGTTATMANPLNAAQVQEMNRARLLAPANLNREIAIDILVRLYELRTRQILTPMSTAASVPGMANATAALQRNLLVGADLGFITGPFAPQGSLTMGELMNMLDIIIQDAGM